jgi:DNA primase
VRAELKEAAAKRKDSVGGGAAAPFTRAEQILLLAFSSAKEGELYQSAEAAYLEHEADFGRMREDVQEILDRLRAREVGADPMQALEPEQRQALAGVLVSVHGAEPELDYVESAILTLRRASLEQEQRETRMTLQAAERAGKTDEVLELSRKAHEIAVRLRGLD